MNQFILFKWRFSFSTTNLITMRYCPPNRWKNGNMLSGYTYIFDKYIPTLRDQHFRPIAALCPTTGSTMASACASSRRFPRRWSASSSSPSVSSSSSSTGNTPPGSTQVSIYVAWYTVDTGYKAINNRVKMGPNKLITDASTLHPISTVYRV